MGLGDLRAGGGEFLHGYKRLAAGAGSRQVKGRRLAQATDGDERCPQLLVAHDGKLYRVTVCDAHGRKGKAAEVKLIHDLQGGEDIILRRRGLLIPQFIDLRSI